jgi:hypothetical protein
VYADYIAFMFIVWISQQRVSFALYCTSLTDWFFITEVDNVYCAVRAESLYSTDKSRPYYNNNNNNYYTVQTKMVRGA